MSTCKHEKTRKFGYRLTRNGKKPQVQCLDCGKVFVKEEK